MFKLVYKASAKLPLYHCLQEVFQSVDPAKLASFYKYEKVVHTVSQNLLKENIPNQSVKRTEYIHLQESKHQILHLSWPLRYTR